MDSEELYYVKESGHYFHTTLECQLLVISEATKIETVTPYQVGLRSLLECPYCREPRGTKDG